MQPPPPLLTHPSYLHVLGTTELREIWNKAGQALNKADVVEVWGYSLPESDQAVRALVAPLIDRLEHSKVSVIVHDPDFEARERWKKFLGSTILAPN